MSVLILIGFLLIAVTGKFFVAMVQKMYIDNKVVYGVTTLASIILFFIIFISVISIVAIITSNGYVVIKSNNLITV